MYSRRMDEAMGVLQDVQQRDDNLYRVIFSGRSGAFGYP